MKEKIKNLQNDIDTLKEQLKEKLEGKKDINLSDYAKSIDFNKFKDSPYVRLKLRRTLKGHLGKIYAMHWTNDPSIFISASQDGLLLTWNALNTNKLNYAQLDSSWVMTCASNHFSEGYMASGGMDNTVSIYYSKDHHNPEFVSLLEGHLGFISCCRFVDNSQILSGSGDRSCILWDFTQKNIIKNFEHERDVLSLSISPTDPNMFVTGSCGGCAKIWDIRTGECETNIFAHNDDINTVEFLSQGYSFGTGSDDGSCTICDIRNCVLMEYKTDDPSPITSIAFSNSSALLFAACDNGNCNIFDTYNNAMIQSIKHDLRVSTLGTNNNGSILCTGCWDRFLRIWC